MTLTAYPSDTRPLGSKAIAIIARGVAITTGASSASAAIPDTSIGIPPNRVRLSASAACYARLGTPDEGNAAMAAPGSGYAIGELITLAGGTYSSPMVLAVATGKLVSTALNAL